MARKTNFGMEPSPPPSPRDSDDAGRRPALLGAVFIGLLCGFVGIFIGLSIGGLRELRNTSELRADPVGAAVIIPAIEETTAPVLLLGDSRVSNWSPPPRSEDLEWAAIGVPGLTATQLAGATAISDLDLVDRTVLVQVGINDLKTLGYTDRPPEDILEALRSALGRIHQRLEAAGARVMVMTIVPPGPVPFSRRFIWTELIDRSVRQVNDELVAGSIVPSADVIDLRDVVGTDGALSPQLAAGTLELNADGYELISERVVDSLAVSPVPEP